MKKNVYAQIALTVLIPNVEGEDDAEIIDKAENKVMEWSTRTLFDHVEAWELEDHTHVEDDERFFILG